MNILSIFKTKPEPHLENELWAIWRELQSLKNELWYLRTRVDIIEKVGG
jgi:hypothetical protein